jgi:adenosylcobinamide kinase/adenosylcobinamide-phosphate guanylyltransferase
VKVLSQIILILGGARSGKSSFAERIAHELGGDEVVYLATAQALDEEMEDRIKHHKGQRPQSWETIEEPIKVSNVIADIEGKKTVLMDCLTLFISNKILKNNKLGDEGSNLQEKFDIEKNIIKEIENIINTARKREINLIIVSNEVGQGIVPNNELSRLFRDIAGRANQFTADKADRVFMTIAGYPIDLKEVSVNQKKNFLKNLKED